MSRLSIAMILPLLIAPATSVAQTAAPLGRGQHVRVVSRCKVATNLAPDCAGDSRWTYTGELEAMAPDSLRLREQAGDGDLVIPMASVDRLEVREGTKGHFWTGAGIGLVGGALLGAAIGSTTEFCIDECTAEDAKAGAIEVGVAVGAPVGFLIGGVIGAHKRTDQWRLISIADQRVGVTPRLDALGVTVDVRF